MPHPLLAAVPAYVAHDLLAHPHNPPAGRDLRFNAVALFADISGFTALSEALGQYGRAGTEALTRLLNDYFGAMIDLVHGYGGMVSKFGGDALLAVFPYPASSPAPAVRRAIRCAMAMQAAMPRFQALETPAGRFGLGLKVGLAKGALLATTAGDPALRLEHVLAGKALERCAEAEHLARKGDVVIEDGLLEYTGALAGDPAGDGFTRVLGLRQPARRAPLEPLPETLPNPALATTLEAFLPRPIAERLRAGQQGFIDEHRRITAAFIRFDGLDYEGEALVSSRLGAYLTSVVRTVHRYQGHLAQVDIGDKGSKLVLLFGAPVAHEDDEERALRCVLELRALTAAAGLTAAIGVHTGLAWCGLVGSPRRREYTAIGDTVNLAARLMQHAGPNRILVADPHRGEYAARFGWQVLPPLQVKGRETPVEVAALLDARGTTGLTPAAIYGLPMVGRRGELTVAAALLEDARSGCGRVLGLSGDPGIGKSRLVAEIEQAALEAGFACHRGEAVSYGTQLSYLPWQALLHSLFGLDCEAPELVQLTALEAAVRAIDPRLSARLPLLGPALSLPIPENPLTRTLDPWLRKTALESLVVDCVRCLAQQRPLLLILEDCHWIDPLSYALLEAVAWGITNAPVLVVVVHRPLEATGQQFRLKAMPHFQELRLSELDQEEAASLVTLKLERRSGHPLSPSPALLEALLSRAEGNPFYLDELVNLVLDRGVDLDDAAMISSFAWPESLHTLILSRIDQLTEGEKATLKVASVIGRAFKASWLWGAWPSLGQPDQVLAHLESLHRLELTTAQTREPELEYLFRHVITRDVAYESLTLATRQMLHGRIAGWLEKAYVHALDRYAGLIAYHYSFTQDRHKQREYFRRAGDVARRAFHNEAAIDYYQRLLPLLADDARFDEERFEVRLSLAEVLALLGRHEETLEQLEAARAQAEARDDHHRLGRVLSHLANQWWRRGRHAKAIALDEQAITLLERAGDARLAAGCLHNLGTNLENQGRFEEAMPIFERSLRIFEELGETKGVSIALMSMGLVQLGRGRCDMALELFERSIRLKEAIDDRQGLAICHNNVGLAHFQRGDYARAVAAFKASLELKERIGDRRGISISLLNIGGLYLADGRYTEALSVLEKSLELKEQIQERWGIPCARQSIGHALFALGRYEEGLEMLNRALEQAVAMGMGSLVLATRGLIALCQLATGRKEEGRATLEAVSAAVEGAELDEEHRTWLFYHLYQGLEALRDRRAEEWLARAWEAVRDRAAAIPEEQARAQFMRAVRLNREIGEAVRRRREAFPAPPPPDGTTGPAPIASAA